MAFVKTAICIIGSALLHSAAAAQFPVRHDHLYGSCQGQLTVDADGVRYAGEQDHQWKWSYQEIRRFKLSAQAIDIVTYKDNLWRLGADQEFHFAGQVPSAEIHVLLKDRLDQRFVAAIAAGDSGDPLFSAPAKLKGRIKGTHGGLVFGKDGVVYSTDARGESRSWRYSDINNLSSASPFELTITTYERPHGFNFELKQPLTESKYNELWLHIQRKNGRIQ